MERVKIGIAGVGKLGTFHCNTLSQMAEAELTGLYDIDAGRARRALSGFTAPLIPPTRRCSGTSMPSGSQCPPPCIMNTPCPR